VGYLAPAYPIVFAAGAVALDGSAARRRIGWLVPAYAVLLVLGGALIAPLAMPILPVERFIAYQAALGQKPSTEEKKAVGPLPQDFADRHGWQELAATVASVHARLTSEERASCAIVTGNYGEAGAIDRFGPRLGLPPARSGHNNYWLWG